LDSARRRPPPAAAGRREEDLPEVEEGIPAAEEEGAEAVEAALDAGPALG
jgi:hypothetical protein